MSLLARFLDPAFVSLKVCGVTRPADAAALVDLGADALGVNFWPHSKRYLDPASAAWLEGFAGRILRVGVFVNVEPSLALDLVARGWLDAVQLHGDESPADARIYRDAGVPFLKAIGVAGSGDLNAAADYGAAGILLDAHAPGVYGGTGECFDWDEALGFHHRHPDIPLILAGGITPDNAARAASHVRPAALDVASGAESSPGVKCMDMVAALLAAVKPQPPC